MSFLIQTLVFGNYLFKILFQFPFYPSVFLGKFSNGHLPDLNKLCFPRHLIQHHYALYSQTAHPMNILHVHTSHIFCDSKWNLLCLERNKIMAVLITLLLSSFAECCETRVFQLRVVSTLLHIKRAFLTFNAQIITHSLSPHHLNNYMLIFQKQSQWKT